MESPKTFSVSIGNKTMLLEGDFSFSTEASYLLVDKAEYDKAIARATKAELELEVLRSFEHNKTRIAIIEQMRQMRQVLAYITTVKGELRANLKMIRNMCFDMVSKVDEGGLIK